MSATQPASTTELKEYCLRKLGKPVIDINLADEQMDDMIQESIQVMQKHHFEGSHAVYEVIEEHHEHMVDVETGKVLEFQDQELIDKLNKIASDAGYQIVDHNLVLHVKKI